MYKITLSGNNEAIAGLESLTEEQAYAWLSENQEHFEEPNEFLDTVKYILVPLDSE
jgi:post-segregation antitoxin (ccd killing protein)